MGRAGAGAGVPAIRRLCWYQLILVLFCVFLILLCLYLQDDLPGGALLVSVRQ